MEDESLQGLYRLLSRSSQALSLIDMLRSSVEEKNIPVQWNSFGKLSFKSLVVSQVVHDKVKVMLTDLLSGACKSGANTIADQITGRLTSECYQVSLQHADMNMQISGTYCRRRCVVPHRLLLFCSLLSPCLIPSMPLSSS